MDSIGDEINASHKEKCFHPGAVSKFSIRPRGGIKLQIFRRPSQPAVHLALLTKPEEYVVSILNRKYIHTKKAGNRTIIWTIT